MRHENTNRAYSSIIRIHFPHFVMPQPYSKRDFDPLLLKMNESFFFGEFIGKLLPYGRKYHIVKNNMMYEIKIPMTIFSRL